MSEESNIKERVEHFLEGVKFQCNGFDHDLITYNEGYDIGLNHNEEYFKLENDLNKYLKTTNKKFSLESLQAINNMLFDFIEEIELKTLIKDRNIRVENSSFEEAKDKAYNGCNFLFDLVKDFKILIEKNIKKLEEDTYRYNKDSNEHCKDVKPDFAVELFSYIIENPNKIKPLYKKDQAVLLAKLTGYSIKTFKNHFSTPTNKYIKDIEELIDILSH